MLKIVSDKNFDVRLDNLLMNMRYLSSLDKGSSIEFDKNSFITPITILPLIPIIKNRELEIVGLSEYCKVIKFPDCLNEMDKLNRYSNSTYLPIFHLKGLRGFDKFDLLTSQYVNLVKENLTNSNKTFGDKLDLNLLGQLFGELTDNVTQHSKAKNAYIFGQYFPKKKCFEFCIMDDGVGIYGSLAEAGRDVENEFDAVYKVMNDYLSSKQERGEEKRGTGIKNTRKLINNDEVMGDFMIISNSTGYLESNSVKMAKNYYQLTEGVFSGIIVSCRIYEPNDKINWYKYVTN